ncbi:MAG TPA: STAS domain-containing protein [Aeromonadales bacterium]|nr:STAS domain-containing protein [Aeromonadales bacterium]
MLNIQHENNIWFLNGDLNMFTSPELWHNRKAIFNTADKQIIINLSKIKRTDSAGLATLVALFKIARDKNKDILFQGASTQLFEIAQVGGVVDILPFEKESHATQTH